MKTEGFINSKLPIIEIEYAGKIYEYLRSEVIILERKTILIFYGIATTAELVADEVIHLQKEFNVIAPTLNHVKSFVQWSKVVNHILSKEGVDQVFVKGASFGGIVAQGFYHYNHSK